MSTWLNSLHRHGDGENQQACLCDCLAPTRPFTHHALRITFPIPLESYPSNSATTLRRSHSRVQLTGIQHLLSATYSSALWMPDTPSAPPPLCGG
jgi:hypothetical protein